MLRRLLNRPRCSASDSSIVNKVVSVPAALVGRAVATDISLSVKVNFQLHFSCRRARSGACAQSLQQTYTFQLVRGALAWWVTGRLEGDNATHEHFRG